MKQKGHVTKVAGIFRCEQFEIMRQVRESKGSVSEGPNHVFPSSPSIPSRDNDFEFNARDPADGSSSRSAGAGACTLRSEFVDAFLSEALFTMLCLASPQLRDLSAHQGVEVDSRSSSIRRSART
jgi:hypothetical protein